MMKITPTKSSVNTLNTNWSKRRYSIMALICWTVGLSNCWRFPVVISNEGGGGAFLIPCSLVSIFILIPLTYMELSMGQFSNNGPIGVWKMCLFWEGAGWASIYLLFSLTLYYCTICSYLLFYTIASLESKLPWSTCNFEFAKDNCFTFETNRSIREACTNKFGKEYCENNVTWQNSAAHYWGERVLQRLTTGSPGYLRWELLLCNLFSFIVAFFCLRNGTKSLQKVVTFLCIVPHLEQTVLLFVSLIHPGSIRGMQRFLQPDFTKLQNFRTWRLAVEQTLCSIGVGLGGLITLGSQNSFRDPIHVHAIVACLTDLMCSLTFGIMSFNALGALSYTLTVPIEEILEWPDTMLFVRIPLALLYWPGASQLWSLLFYSSVYLIGLRSLIFIIAALLSALYEAWPVTQKYNTLSVATTLAVLFICSLPYFTQLGSILLNYMDNMNAGCLLLMIIVFEVIGVMWLYGTNNFVNDVHFMLGFRPSTFWQFSWVTCPLTLFFFFVTSTIDWNEGTEGLPPWMWLYILQCFLLCIPILLIVLFAAFYLINTNGLKFSKILKPSPSWGPVDPILRKSRDMFSAHSMTKEYMYRQNRLRSRKFLPPEVPVVLPPKANVNPET